MFRDQGRLSWHSSLESIVYEALFASSTGPASLLTSIPRSHSSLNYLSQEQGKQPCAWWWSTKTIRNTSLSRESSLESWPTLRNLPETQSTCSSRKTKTVAWTTSSATATAITIYGDNCRRTQSSGSQSLRIYRPTQPSLRQPVTDHRGFLSSRGNAALFF